MKIDKDDAQGWRREARAKKKHLKELSGAVTTYLEAMDVEMQRADILARGRHVAALSNALEMANDKARYFGLDVNWRKDKK